MTQLEKLLTETRDAAIDLMGLCSKKKESILQSFSSSINKNRQFLLDENRKDLQQQKNKISSSLFQRLELSEAKIDALVTGIQQLAHRSDPVGCVRLKRALDENLILEQKTVPLGVVAVIFESRPDVIPQILALMLKTNNACILKGGKEALHSNRAFMHLVEELDKDYPELPNSWSRLLSTRSEIHELLSFPQYVDLVIPRGSNKFVHYIMTHTVIPVLGHADGVCHIYFDGSFDKKQGIDVIMDAKVQYPSVCNAMETLIVKDSCAEVFIPLLKKTCEQQGVKIFGCEITRRFYPEIEQVDDWHKEYGQKSFSLKSVANVEQAVQHINRYGSHHTDVILSKNKKNIDYFKQFVDSANVFVNVSSRFSDGYVFGMGAEVGVSTSKIHARGPVGIEGLLSYRYELVGDGQRISEYTGKLGRKFVHRDLA